MITELFSAVALVEGIHAAAGVDDLLLAGIEGMALIADIDFEHIDVFGRARSEFSAAGAYHVDHFIIGMKFLFHFVIPRNF